MQFFYSVVDRDTAVVLRGGWSHTQELADRQPHGANELLLRGEWSVGTRLLGDVVSAPVVSKRDVQNFVARILSYTDGYAVRASEPDGKPMPEHVLAYRRAVRARGNEIEAMNPIPADYRDAKFWPEAL